MRAMTVGVFGGGTGGRSRSRGNSTCRPRRTTPFGLMIVLTLKNFVLEFRWIWTRNRRSRDVWKRGFGGVLHVGENKGRKHEIRQFGFGCCLSVRSWRIDNVVLVCLLVREVWTCINVVEHALLQLTRRTGAVDPHRSPPLPISMDRSCLVLALDSLVTGQVSGP